MSKRKKGRHAPTVEQGMRNVSDETLAHVGDVISEADGSEIRFAALSWKKKLLFWIFSLGVIGVATLALAEVTVRLVPGPWTNTFFHRYDAVLGTWHIPDHVGTYEQDDFKTEDIHINSFGMRDIERTIATPEGVTRVAVLGDSFTEAFHVRDEETFTRQIEANFAGKVEVMNFGVAGFGTVQQLLTYREKVRQFNPDVVVLAFLSANDMRNNLKVLEDMYTGTDNTDRPFGARYGTSSVAITPPQPKPSATNPAILFVKKHFALYRFAWHMKGRLAAMYASAPSIPVIESESEHGTSTATNTSTTGAKSSAAQTAVATATASTNPNVYLAGLSAPPTDDALRDAWFVTEWSIATLRDEVEDDGAKFLLVTLPSALHMERDPKATLEKEYGTGLPKGFSIDYPEMRLAQFAKKSRIAFLDLTPRFRAYRDATNMQSPYFSYEHDGHWRAIGHELAAVEIAEKFVLSGIVK